MTTPKPDRRMLVLAPTAFLGSVSIGVIGLAMLFVIKERFGASAQTVGWFTASVSITYFAGCLSLRRVADRIGPRAAMVVMNLGSAILFGAFLLAPSLPLAFVAYGLYGFLTAFFWPPLMSWISSGLEGEALGKATNDFSIAWSSGGALAPYIAGLLLELGLSVPVAVAAGLFAFTAFFVIGSRRLAPTPAHGMAGTGGGTRGAPARAGAPGPEAVDRSTPLRYSGWLSVFLVYIILSVLGNIFPLFAKDELGFSESKIGFLLLLRASAAAVGFWVLGRFGFWHFRKRYIALAVGALLVLDLAFIPLRSAFPLGLALVLLGFVHALCYNSSVFYGASGALDRTRRMTINEATITVGQTLGSIGGGFVYGLLSWSMVLVLLAGVFALGFAAQLFLLGRRR